MKFMMSDALTVGARDGATAEIAEEVGDENVSLFGLTAEQFASSRGWYDPRWHYEQEHKTRQVLTFSGHFHRGEPHLVGPLRDGLLKHSDCYMHVADLTFYDEAQSGVSELYADRDEWANPSSTSRTPDGPQAIG